MKRGGFNRIQGLIGLLLALPLAASEPSCEAVLEQAELIRQMREHDAAAGVAEATQQIEAFGQVSISWCPEGMAQLYRARASNLTVLGNNDEALDDIDRGREVIGQSGIDAPRHLAALHLSAGVAYWELEKHDQAIGEYLQSLTLSEQAGDQDGVARAAGNLGNLYNTLGYFDQSREFHQRALAAFEAIGNEIGQAGTLINLAALDFRRATSVQQDEQLEEAEQAHQSALNYARRSLEFFERLGNPLGIAIASNNVANALDSLGRVEESLPYFQQSLEIRRQVGDRLGTVEALITQSNALIKLDRLDEADALLTDASQLIPDDHLSLTTSYHRRRVLLAEAREDYLQALNHQKSLTAVGRRIAENQMALQVEELRLGFEAERQDQQLELLRNEATIRDLQLERQRLASMLAFGLALALLILLLLVFRLYRQGRRMSQALELVARRDPLTGLANRREMDGRLADFTASAASRPKRQAALILVDVDNFKAVNDQLGHQAGDRVLVEIAHVLEKSLGRNGRLARWGGEEFLVLAPDHDRESATRMAESLRAAVEQAGLQGGDAPVTATVGLTLMRVDEPAHAAISRADAALYRGKNQGRNQVIYKA